VTERLPFINACRQVIATTEAFNTSRIGIEITRVGTLNLGTQIKLTGVLAPGVAQVYLPNRDGSIQLVGWVNASHLGPCGGSPIGSGPPATITPSSLCYRIDTPLIARLQASDGSTNVGRFLVGDIAQPTTSPPTERRTPDGRIWTQVRTYSGTGWIARTGPNAMGSNVTWLSADQCVF